MTDELLINRMVDEWRALEARRRTARAERIETRVGGWEQAIDSMVAEVADIRARGQWVSGPGDLLGVLGRGRRETTHCAILAWLLDPSGAHGLGTALLERVLATAKVAEPSRKQLAHVRTRCEVVAPRSRADIVVSAEDFKVVFEAKVDAVERPEQCDDLYTDHHDGAPGAPTTAFIFLTPYGRAPSTATGAAATAFKPLSFVQVRNELRELAATHRAQMKDAGGWHAAMTWLDTLEREF